MFLVYPSLHCLVLEEGTHQNLFQCCQTCLLFKDRLAKFLLMIRQMQDIKFILIAKALKCLVVIKVDFDVFVLIIYFLFN